MEQKIIILDSNGSEALDELLDILPEDIVNDWVCGQKVGHQNLMNPGSFARRNKDCIL